MKDFLKMVSRTYHRNYEYSMEAIKSQQISCAYFNPDTTLDSGIVDGLIDWGIRLDTICTWDKNVENLNHESCHVRGIREFLSNPRDVKIMFLHPLLWLTVLDKHISKVGVDTISLCDMQDAIDKKNILTENLPRLYETYSCFEQEESRKAYLAVILGKISNRIHDYHFAPEPQYMLEGFLPKQGDIAIDGGAYDGGTAKLFASLGAKVFAFEMDKYNYNLCCEKTKLYDVVVENMGLSDREGEEHYKSIGTASSKQENGNEIAHFISIDIYVERKELPRVDYIKLDVEGAELDVLQGAASSIIKWKPKMALSAYHKTEDLWMLREYISSICPSYRFEFRHYPIDVTDYWLGKYEKSLLTEYNLGNKIPTGCEMVLYCY